MVVVEKNVGGGISFESGHELSSSSEGEIAENARDDASRHFSCDAASATSILLLLLFRLSIAQ